MINENHNDFNNDIKSSSIIENNIINSNLDNSTKSEVVNYDEEEENTHEISPSNNNYTIPSGSFIKREESYMSNIPYTKYEFENFSYFNFPNNKSIFIISDTYELSNKKYIIPIELSYNLRYSLKSEEENKINEYSTNKSKLVLNKVNSLINELNKYMIFYIEKDFIKLNNNINSKILKMIWIITSLLLLLIPALVLLYIIELDYLYKTVCISLSCLKIAILIYLLFHRLRISYVKPIVLLECFLMKEPQFIYFINKWNKYLRQFNYKIQISSDLRYLFLVYYENSIIFNESYLKNENNEIDFCFDDK